LDVSHRVLYEYTPLGRFENRDHFLKERRGGLGLAAGQSDLPERGKNESHSRITGASNLHLDRVDAGR
jgi:hypothetical protein